MNNFEGGMPVINGRDKRKESDPHIKNEENNLQAALQQAEEVLGAEKIIPKLSEKTGDKYLISEQERQDALMDTEKKGWAKYWQNRLISEIRLLPEEVRSGLLNFQKTKKFPVKDMNVFQEYVNNRIRAKRFELRKREEMSKFKQDLIDIDNEKSAPFESEGDRRTIYFNDQTQTFYFKDKNGNISKENISFGDLMGDHAWGIKYRPDISVPHKIWRRVRKTLSIYETRDEIGKIFNEELNDNYHTGLPTTAIGIEFLDKQLSGNSENPNGVSGILAERMITEFLTRIQYNNPDLGMKVEKANALEDTMLKYDFKIVFDKVRGIALESEDVSREEFKKNKKRIGVQFTISSLPNLLYKKSRQIEEAKMRTSEFAKEAVRKVDDIVLVSMPILKVFRDLYSRWVSEGRPCGGPEQYLSREQKLDIFKQATKGLLDLSEKEIADLKI